MTHQNAKDFFFAYANRQLIGSWIDKALCLKEHISILSLHIVIRRIIFSSSDKFFSTAKSLGLQLFRSFHHGVALGHSKTHQPNASLGHYIHNLAIAQSAFDLVGPCLQLRSQALVASLQAKGHRVLNQLFFVEQLGNIRSRHAFLYNNQVGAGNGKILIIAINAQPG